MNILRKLAVVALLIVPMTQFAMQAPKVTVTRNANGQVTVTKTITKTVVNNNMIINGQPATSTVNKTMSFTGATVEEAEAMFKMFGF
jgi:hypothetical protein